MHSGLGIPGQRDATYTDDWYETTDSGITEVFAGAVVSDPSVGFVDVVHWDADHANVTESFQHLAPGSREQ